MAITFTCPHCSKTLEAPDQLAGKDAVCPSCKNKVTVPDEKEK